MTAFLFIAGLVVVGVSEKRWELILGALLLLAAAWRFALS